MLRLSIDQILKKIQQRDTFEAVSEEYSLHLKITSYVPYVCAAVHDGHQFRKSLWNNCLHTEYDRWYEEDPYTRQMVANHPIVLSGLDSRFEYDLNRDPEQAIFDTAWGKQLWKTPLEETTKAVGLQKHRDFYKVAHALVGALEQLFPKILVFDMHSYNWKRWDRPVPTWNLGTANIDSSRFGAIASSWSYKLGGMQLPHHIPTDSKINDTFQGNGYFLKYITSNFKNTLVLATEVSKIYCDELTGIVFPEVVQAIAKQLQELIPQQVQEFEEARC
ncbi:MAG: N-formylglutamate amidohydrolase [Bacteroidota bacterium]